MRLHALAVWLLASAPAFGSSLTVDGQLAPDKIMGESMLIEISGTPGKIPYLIADVLPGPSFAYGQSLPIGFSPFVVMTALPPIPAGGTLALPAVTPALPSLDGQDIYLLAVVLDEAAQFGLDFSNGAGFKIIAQPTAGSDQATLVGRKVLLDGGRAALPDGTAKPGYTVLWVLASTPPGSQAAIVDPTRPFAVLTPDVAGEYIAQLQVNTAGGAYVSQTVVHAWQVLTQPFPDGGISVVSSFNLSGQIVGPPVASATLDGAPLPLQPNGSFGPIPVTILPTDVARGFRFRVTHQDGTTANHHMTLFQGTPWPLSIPSSKTLSARLDQDGLDDVAALGEAQLESVDLKSVLLAIPAQQVANNEGPFGFTIFSATIKFKNLTYNPNINLDLTATSGAIHSLVSIFNVKADFDVWGEVLEVDYNLTGSITTSPTTINADMVGSAQAGKLAIALKNVTVDRANFNFNLDGFLGSVGELFVVESSVKEQVESTIASEIQASLGPAVEEILNSFVLAGNLYSVLEVDVNIEAPIRGVVHDAAGVTIQLDGKATVGVPEPGSPPTAMYRATPTAPPVFGGSTPAGQPFEAALTVADDFVNQILAAGTGAGLLDGDLTSLFPSGGTSPVNLPTDQLAQLFPDAGFDHFAVGTSVRLQAHGTVPPVLCLTPGGPSTGGVRMDNVEVEFEVDTPYGPLPMLRIALNGFAEVNLVPGTGSSLELSVGASTIDLSVLRVFPGANPGIMDGQIGFLSAIFNFAMPDLISAIGDIPLPSLEAAGLGIVPAEAGLIGAGGSHLGLFGALQVVPGS